ncbi:MAG: SRPBCC family protein [Pedobacter sp.]|nr:SRPBCC family protein [Pedobacter sp.]
MLKKIAIGFAVLVAAILLFAATRPDTFRVERKTVIAASPERIQAEISNFQRWKVWSPYEKKDPAMKRSYSGPESGVGAKYAWEGDSNVGSGSMEVISATPQEVRIKLDFLVPFEAHNTAIFTLAPQSNGTEVTWAMEGPVPYFAKIIHLFFNMDKMVGTDFEAGLADLKIVTETQP